MLLSLRSLLWRHAASGNATAHFDGASCQSAAGEITGEATSQQFINVGGGLPGRVRPQFRPAPPIPWPVKKKAEPKPEPIRIDAEAEMVGVGAKVYAWPLSASGDSRASLETTDTVMVSAGMITGSASASGEAMVIDEELERFALELLLSA